MNHTATTRNVSQGMTATIVVVLVAISHGACAAPPEAEAPVQDATVDAQADTSSPADTASEDVEKPDSSASSQDSAAVDSALDSQSAAVDAGPDQPPECLVDSDCAPFEDADLCNGTLTCDATLKRCVSKAGAAVLCDTSNDTACAQNSCVPSTGKCAMAFAPVGTPCVDSDPCTVDSACKDGACAAANKASWCACQADDDCKAQEDGDLCNGALVCDKAVFPYSCVVSPATIVTCAPTAKTVCETDACDAKTGKCSVVPAPAGTPCEDGNACTVADLCEAGKCAGDDVCACQTDADCAAKDDGDACNGTLVCDKSVAGKHVCKVKAGSVPLCNAATEACAVDTCDPKTGACGVKAAKDGSFCSDGDACTVGEACASGKCSGGAVICACQKDADCAGQEDGNACNGTLRCDLGSNTCQPKADSTVHCDGAKDSFCEKNACAPKTGQCAPTPVESTVEICASGGKCRREVKTGAASTVLCNDGNPCTQNDACKAGKCVPGADVCECQQDSDCAKKDDGDKCNGTFLCGKGGALPKCVFDPKSVVTCPTNNDSACQKSQCFKATGQCAMANVQDGAACNDGDNCTTGDACSSGQCKGTGSCGPTWSEVYNKAFAGFGCGGCHGNYNGAATTYSTLLNDSYCGGKLVVPGHSAGSTIINKMGKGTPLSCGKKMPKGSSGISDDALKLLKDWIDAGAKNN